MSSQFFFCQQLFIRKTLAVLLVIYAILWSFTFPAWAETLSDLSDEQQGKYLTELSSCYTCHTGDNTQPFAGSRKFITQLGTIYSTNITSDKETGIGSWSDEEFYRALHEGIGKDGRQLYPIMPYDVYTGMHYEDVMRIKAWLMSQPPILKKDIPNELQFPYNYRQTVLGWKLLNFYKGGKHPLTSQESQNQQRGIYIAESLALCGSCHTPRTITMGTDPARALTGAFILDNWFAPNITPDKIRGIGKWTDEELKQYLRTGEVPGKAYAMGPMKEIVNDSLVHLNEQDMDSLLVWLRNIQFDGRLTSNNTLSRTEWGRKQDFSDMLPAHFEENEEINPFLLQTPEQLYYGMCANCHGMDGGGKTAENIPNLVRNTTLGMTSANNTIKIILEGSQSSVHSPSTEMPAFKNRLSDRQVAELTNWLFLHYGRNTTQTNVEQIYNLRMNIPIGDAPIIALLKAASIALVAFGLIFILGWIIRFSPRVKALITSLKRKYKAE